MSIKYSDSGFLDGADETKKLSFDVSGVTTGTTRTITMPDANVDLSSVGTPDDNSVTLAKMAGGTDGNLITYDASGDPAYVTTGTSGQVLTSGGTGVAPTFQTAAGGGKVLQVVEANDISNTNGTSSWADTVITASITPSATSSKVLVIWQTTVNIYDTDSSGGYSLRTKRAISGGATSYPVAISHYNTGSSNASYYQNGGATNHAQVQTLTGLDSPSTTSAITYTVQGKSYNISNDFQVGGVYSGRWNIILMEIGA